MTKYETRQAARMACVGRGLFFAEAVIALLLLAVAIFDSGDSVLYMLAVLLLVAGYITMAVTEGMASVIDNTMWQTVFLNELTKKIVFADVKECADGPDNAETEECGEAGNGTEE